MKVLIVEDEIHTAKALIKMLKTLVSNVEILSTIDSVEESIHFISNHPEIELIFMDIQLSDGISFEIFKEIKIDIPIIFTTSYDEYAIKAFEVNSIDYILKPIEEEALKKSLDKFNKIASQSTQNPKLENLLSQINIIKQEYKTRFLVKTVKGYHVIPISEVAYFYIDNQMVFLKTHHDKKYNVNYTLDELEKTIDPKNFFRLNRQTIAAFNSIGIIENYFNNTLIVQLIPPIEKEVVISRYTVKEFKIWLDK
jgi:two-component system, LytTR family, response regulator LytT